MYFQFKARREENSSVFGFQKDITIVSYIPKPRKCVHMMSSLHHDDEVDPESGDKRKPSIIKFYNSTKSGVDVVDKLARTYDVFRNCKRWPLAIFFSMLDHAGINAFVVYMLNNSIERNKSNLRGKFIKQLGMSFLDDHPRKRKENPHIPRDIKKRVQEILHGQLPGPLPKQSRRSQRCSFCLRNKDRKTLNGCFKCDNAICKEHSNLICQNSTDLGRPLNVVPEPSLEDMKISRLSRWQLLRRMTDDFWTKWSKEYLQRYQSMYKWNQPMPDIQLGLIVLITDERYPPSKWPLELIIKVHLGKDDHVQCALLYTKKKYSAREYKLRCNVAAIKRVLTRLKSNNVVQVLTLRSQPVIKNYIYTSTEDANETRLVTKVRWVVAAVNGQLKNWRALDKVVPNSQISYIGDYVRIICAVLNAFHPARIKNTEDDGIIAQRMLHLVKRPNYLKQMVEEKGWIRKKAIWTKLTDTDLQDFPRLTWDELRQLTIGIYQLEQSQSYTQEHLNEEGMYSIYIHREDDSVLRVQLRS
ncbi:hypothetical protein EVAR_80284_1 [Eumeta japonica]|uniref:DUF5641 domain-containing protein n=1 Tax=Eumeta variegata TaxID=151549 RepID=A0A4C1UC12_EUMVA|nr:hypothetical protein EVAR_80284_1 [Eumeta japonica]